MKQDRIKCESEFFKCRKKEQNFNISFGVSAISLLFSIAFLPILVKGFNLDFLWSVVLVAFLFPVANSLLLLFSLFLSNRNISAEEMLYLKWPDEKTLGALVVAGFLFFIGAVLITSQIENVFEYFNIEIVQPLLPKIFVKASLLQKYLLAFVIVILAPIFEELLFRHVVYRFLKKHCGMTCAVIISSLAFTVMHDSAVQYPALFLLGMVFQLSYIKYKSIFAPIFLHFLNNSIALVLLSFV